MSVIAESKNGYVTTNIYAVALYVPNAQTAGALTFTLTENNEAAAMFEVYVGNLAGVEKCVRYGAADQPLNKNSTGYVQVSAGFQHVYVLAKSAAQNVPAEIDIASSRTEQNNESFLVPLLLSAAGVYRLSDDVLVNDAAEETVEAEAYVKVKEINCGYLNGVLRVKFDIKCPLGAWVHGRIYKNGVALSDEHNLNDTGFFTYTDELTFAKGDLIQLYVFNSTPESPAVVRNFKVCGVFAVPTAPAVNVV